MAVLEFIQKGSRWVAEFKATADFNLHIEREDGGFLYVQQRTSESGEYDSVHGVDFASQDKVIDYDFTALVYPKFIKIVSEVEPTYAAVVSDGEVTEIKSQSKEIEVTSNGTTVVTPDAGFAYLNKVSVKTNVATSGGNGGGSASTIEYLDVRGVDFTEQSGFKGTRLFQCSLLINCTVEQMGKLVGPSMQTSSLPSGMLKSISALAVDFNSKIAMAGMDMSVMDMLSQTEWTAEELNAIPRITKEEFYTL